MRRKGKSNLKKSSLESILEENIYSKKPFERMKECRSTPIPILSNLKADEARIFDEKAWGDFIGILKEMYPKGTSGDLILCGGVINKWRFSYSKYEFQRLQQTQFEGAESEGGNFDELEWRMKQAEKYISMIPDNVRIHYTYGAEDMANMIECYSTNIDHFAKYIEGIHRGMKRLEKTIEKTVGAVDKLEAVKSTTLNRITEKYERDLKQVKTEYKLKTTYEKQRLGRRKKDLKEVSSVLESDKLSKDQIPDLKKKKKKLESIISGIEESISKEDVRLEEDISKSKAEYEMNKNVAMKKVDFKAIEGIEVFKENILELKTFLKDNYLSPLEKDLPIESTSKILSDFAGVYDKIDGIASTYDNFSSKKTDATMFMHELEQYNNFLENQRELMMKKYSISEGYGKLVKRNLTKQIRNELIMLIKNTYKKDMEKLFTAGGTNTAREVNIYPKRTTYIKIPTVDGDLKVYVNNNPLSSDPMKKLVKRMHTTLSNGGWTSFEEGSKKKRGRKETIVPDVIIGKDVLPRVMPFSISNKKKEPSYMITVQPFFDVGKARELGDNYLISDEIKNAEKLPATSGLVLMDYNKVSPRFTIFNLDNISLKNNDFLNGLHISDFHSGTGNHRWDLAYAIGKVIEEDKSLELLVETGDFFQSLNYRGAATDDQGMVRIDEQQVAYLTKLLDGFKEVATRSRLESPLIRVPGNHDKPFYELGFDTDEPIACIFNWAIKHMLEGKGDPDFKFMHNDFKPRRLGYNTKMDSLPMKVLRVGHLGYGETELKTKDGKSYGDIFANHKTTTTGSGYKADPGLRTASWIAESGRVEPHHREINVGHSHIAQISNIDGIYVCAAPSLEAMNKNVPNIWKTDSAYGIGGFMRAIPGTWKKYMPHEGAITYEYLHEDILEKVYKEKIEKPLEKYIAALPKRANFL